jgi:hypothetical protein
VPVESVVSSSPKPYSPKPFTRKVSIRKDREDFVVAYQPEDVVVFRNGDARALRRLCTQLRWDIVSDVAPEGNDQRTW